MKRSSPRFSTQQWDNFSVDIDDQEASFLPTRPDDTGLTITPLDHIVDDNEDAIDRLLANSGFDTDNQYVKTAPFTAAKPVIHPVADSLVTDHDDAAFVVQAVPEENLGTANFKVDTFISDYLAMRQPEQPAAPEPDTEASVIAINVKDPTEQPEYTETLPREYVKDMANDNDTLPPQVNIDAAIFVKQLAQLQKQSSTAMRIAYAALACSIAILISSAALYVMMSDIKTDTAKMTVWVESFKEAMDAAATEAPEAL